MAEGWLNAKLAGKGWTAESAGVAAWDGSPPRGGVGGDAIGVTSPDIAAGAVTGVVDGPT